MKSVNEKVSEGVSVHLRAMVWWNVDVLVRYRVCVRAVNQVNRQVRRQISDQVKNQVKHEIS